MPAQGLLFQGDLPELDEDAGYRGPTACKAAGITYRQLDYWARTGLVEPSVRPAGGSGTQRLYGFRDILVLKVVKRLLDTGVSLQQIRGRDPAAARPRRRRPRPDHPDERRRVGLRVHLRPTRSSTWSRADRVSSASRSGKVWREVEGELAHLPSERAEHEVDATPQPGDELGARRAAPTGLTAPTDPPRSRARW